MNTSFFYARSFRYTVAGVLLGLALGLLTLAITTTFPDVNYAPFRIVVAPIILGLLAYVAGRKQDRILQQKKGLDGAKRRFTSLTHSVITEKDWEVGLHDSRVPTCWEVKDCQSSDCPAFSRHHIRCWLLAGTACRGEVQGTYAQKLGDCTKCEVYSEAVSRGPIDEIAEDFNSLMWAVQDKQEKLQATNEELTSRVKELSELQKKTRVIAETDALTGLKNYGHFQKKIKQELGRAKRYGRPLALLMVDVDSFKRINDRFGHQKGDTVLIELGRFITGELRESDYIARYGGERFVIIMPETFGEGAVGFADRMQQRVGRVAEDAGIPERSVSISVGVADFPDCASDIDSLLSAADTALLLASRKGGSKVAYFCDLSETQLRQGDLQRLNSRLGGAGLKTIQALAEAVDAADRYSGNQRTELVQVAGALAERLKMDKEESDCLALAACLHDIGKIGVPSSVLQKTEKLSPDEVALVRQHPQIGQQLLEEAQQIQNLVSAILYHHERWDGKGYPEGLKGEKIPLMARIVGILDAYRAMRCDRPYRQALSVPLAIEELRKGAGTQFDPGLVDVFVELLEKGDGSSLSGQVAC